MTSGYPQFSVPYIIYFIILHFFSLIENINKNIDAKIFSRYFLFISFIFFIGCRGYIGQDWYYYYPFFNSAPGLFDGFDKISYFINNSFFEKGFSFYNVLIKTITNNYLIFQFISATIDFLIINYFFKKYIPNHYILGFLFFYVFQGLIFEIILLRNTKAIMLFLISLEYLKKRKVIPYFTLNIIGISFHSSAVIFLPLYFFLDKQIDKKIILLLFFIGNIVYLFQIQWFKELLLFITNQIDLGRYNTLINNYMNSQHYSSSFGITIGYLERSFTFILFYYYKDKFDNMRIFYNSLVLYLCIYLFLSEFFILIERLPNLFVFSYWILYPRIYADLNRMNKAIFIIIFIIYGVLKLIIMNDHISLYYENALFGSMGPEIRLRYFSTIH